MLLNVNGISVEVNQATPSDAALLVKLIGQMAAFEKLDATVTEADLRASLFGEAPAAQAVIVSLDGAPIGYMTYFFSFSSMRGKRALWLDDLYIVPEARGKGIGKALMAYMAKVAADHDCVRFEWIVLDWNTPAVDLYKRLGAEILPEWRICRLDETQTRRLAGTLCVKAPKG